MCLVTKGAKWCPPAHSTPGNLPALPTSNACPVRDQTVIATIHKIQSGGAVWQIRLNGSALIVYLSEENVDQIADCTYLYLLI